MKELEPGKFRSDRLVVEFCDEQRGDLPPDDRLDELGSEIHLLDLAEAISLPFKTEVSDACFLIRASAR